MAKVLHFPKSAGLNHLFAFQFLSRIHTVKRVFDHDGETMVFRTLLSVSYNAQLAVDDEMLLVLQDYLWGRW